MTTKTKKIVIYIEAIVGVLLIIAALQIFTPLKPYTNLKYFINYYVISGNYAAKDYHISPDDYNKPPIEPTKKTLNIFIRNSKFEPADSTISPGTEVNWYNSDKIVHTVTGKDWNSGSINPSALYTKTFDTAGTYDYHCSIHPQMTGQLIVK